MGLKGGQDSGLLEGPASVELRGELVYYSVGENSPPLSGAEDECTARAGEKWTTSWRVGEAGRRRRSDARPETAWLVPRTQTAGRGGVGERLRLVLSASR